MKNSAVVTVNKLLNLSELGIEPMEICWSKVKMTSSRWITCCHRKLKKSSPQPPPTSDSIESFRYGSDHKSDHSIMSNGKQHKHHSQSHQQQRLNDSRSSAYSTDGGGDLYSSTITRNIGGKQRNSNSKSDSKRTSNARQTAAANHHNHHDDRSEFISSSYQTNEHSEPLSHHHHHHHNNAHHGQQPSSNFRNFPNGFCSSSISSQFTPSSASPVSGSSIYERKSSASSSASSNHSSYSATIGKEYTSGQPIPNSHFTTLMRHSKSNIDLNDHLPYSANNYTNSLSRPSSKHREITPKSTLCVENTITIINPRDGALISCQTDEDSNCAQISPQINVIAVSNEYWIAFYSISTNDRLGVLELPRSCSYWTWISADTVAVVSRGEVLHWTLPNSDADSNCIRAYDRKRLVFEVDSDVACNQIINYAVDPLFDNWCALSTLYVDDSDDIEGKVQIYSHLHKQSQCIRAHSCAFTAYQFDDSGQQSTMLILAKREKDHRWKLHIIELGPIPEGNRSHRPISQTLKEHLTPDSSSQNGDTKYHSLAHSPKDIPTHIACDSSLGLIYLLSKYGSFYICDIETGLPLYYDTFHDLTGDSALFTFSYDQSTSSLLSVSRAGLVFTFHVSLEKLLSSNRNGIVAPKVLERIQKRLRAHTNKSPSSRPSSVTKHLQEFEQIFDPLTTDSNYSSSPTTSELESSSTNHAIMSPYRFHYGDKVDDNDEDGHEFGRSVGHFLNGSTSRPQPIYVESDCSEEVTRL